MRIIVCVAGFCIGVALYADATGGAWVEVFEHCFWGVTGMLTYAASFKLGDLV